MSTVKLRNWQEEALDLLEKNNYCGQVFGCTGSGKTTVGIEVIKKLNKPSTIVTCPTSEIANQWIEYFKSIGINRGEIGLVGGKWKQTNRKYIIGIINSLRKLKLPNHDLLIFDEFHHYASPENKKFLKNHRYAKYRIGLTATHRDEKDEDEFLSKFTNDVIFEYGQDQGIKDGVISDYKIVNVSVPLTNDELLRYIEVNVKIRTLMPLFGNNYKRLFPEMNRGNLKAIDAIRAYNDRKKILYKSTNKAKESAKIIANHYNNGDKIVVFSEISDIITGYRDDKGKYHQGVADYLEKLNIPFLKIFKDYKDDIKLFLNNEFRVLLTCKKLNEGYNDPELNIGILVSGNSKSGAFIQISGRLIRKCEGKGESIMYQLYVPETQDEVWLKSRLSKVKKRKTEWK